MKSSLIREMREEEERQTRKRNRRAEKGSLVKGAVVVKDGNGIKIVDVDVERQAAAQLTGVGGLGKQADTRLGIDAAFAKEAEA
jgi:hypothetical protein